MRKASLCVISVCLVIGSVALPPPAAAVDDLIGDLVEPGISISQAESRPTCASNCVAFNETFSTNPDANGDGVNDRFKASGDWDYVSLGTDFYYDYGTGYQELTVLERHVPLPNTSVDRPGGARLEPQRCKNRTVPCGMGGDVGIHRVFKTRGGDTWLAEMWAYPTSEFELHPDDFKARLTIHYYDSDGDYLTECKPNGFIEEPDPLSPSKPQHVFIRCTVPTGADVGAIRVNARAHAGSYTQDGDEYASASGQVLVDRFQLTLEVPSVL